MSKNGEIYTAGKKFYTAAGTDGMDKFHLCILFLLNYKFQSISYVQGFCQNKSSTLLKKREILAHLKYMWSIFPKKAIVFPFE